LGVIDLDTPSEVIEISSSCDLSIFSSRNDSQCAEGGGGTPEVSSSMSIGELWPDIDKLDEISRKGVFASNISRGVRILSAAPRAISP
jgi:hypothetical protein